MARSSSFSTLMVRTGRPRRAKAFRRSPGSARRRDRRARGRRDSRRRGARRRRRSGRWPSPLCAADSTGEGAHGGAVEIELETGCAGRPGGARSGRLDCRPCRRFPPRADATRPRSGRSGRHRASAPARRTRYRPPRWRGPRRRPPQRRRRRGRSPTASTPRGRQQRQRPSSRAGRRPTSVKHRIAPADVERMVERRRADPRRIAGRIVGGRLGQHGEMLGDICRRRRFERLGGGGRIIIAGRAGLGDDEAGGPRSSAVSARAKVAPSRLSKTWKRMSPMRSHHRGAPAPGCATACAPEPAAASRQRSVVFFSQMRDHRFGGGEIVAAADVSERLARRLGAVAQRFRRGLQRRQMDLIGLRGRSGYGPDWAEAMVAEILDVGESRMARV